MTQQTKITKSQAKHLIIDAQQLNNNLNSLDIINKLGYVQIDTLSVAERAHHHVFQSRNPNYRKTDLDEMMVKKQVFEYWSHAASYLPIADYRFSLIKKITHANGQSHWFAQDKKMNRHVMDRIKAEGPLQSKDFKQVRETPSEWYDYKPAKIALEQMFIEGKLMIKERRNFQKVYDLPENVLPSDINTTTPTLEEYYEHLILSVLRAQGLATINEIGYLRKGIRSALTKSINKLVETGEITPLLLEGDNQTYFTQSNNLQNTKPAQEVHILSPFDNLVIQRKRLQTLFDFEYQIECYVPEAKRKYGYYCLPVLYGDKFVARLDPKADRKTGVFTIKKIWFETNFTPDEAFYFKFSEKIKQFASFCGCSQVVIKKSTPASYKKELMSFIKR